MASLIDIAPTLLSLAGIDPTLLEVKDQMRGIDLSPILEHPGKSVQEDILYVTDDDIVGSVFEDLDGSNLSGGNRRRERKHEREYLKKLKQVVGEENPLESIPRHVRAIKTADNWKLVRYTLEATEVSENASTTVYEMYDLNIDATEENNLAFEIPTSGPIHDRFEDLKARLDVLLDEKYYHDSMRECE